MPAMRRAGPDHLFDPKRVVASRTCRSRRGDSRWDAQPVLFLDAAVARADYGFDVEAPFESLPESSQNIVLHGSAREDRLPLSGEKGRSGGEGARFRGHPSNLERRHRETDSVAVKKSSPST